MYGDVDAEMLLFDLKTRRNGIVEVGELLSHAGSQVQGSVVVFAKFKDS